ncbi:MAG TPA: Ig-like domain-containing protein [Streptosporangiaceae bacterium]|nr:Ig-like domain-containing protein [Streptosporangiaceae bacterium]
MRHVHGRATVTLTAGCAVLSLLAAACQSTAGGPGHGRGTGGSEAATSTLISITPRNGTSGATPSQGVTVTVARGKLSSVSVQAGSRRMAGSPSNGGTVWHSRWALYTGTHYTVTAVAVGPSHKTVTATSSFRTLTPAATDTASTPMYPQTYGVGMPIMICFSSPVSVAHRAQVERSIEIKSSKPVVGAWMWESAVGTCSAGTQALEFRTRNYWPQHTQVSFDAHLNGLAASRRAYFTANLSESFTIGNSLVAEVSYTGHHARIYYKDKLHGVWLDSAGTSARGAETETANGTYLSIEKGNPVLMTGQGYTNVPVYDSVRFTWSGDYMHSAPWSVGEQGFTNVSHGCVNLSPADATWYYDHSVPGDPVTITHSPLAGTFGDGWTEWFLTWNQALRASATHMAVQAGPSGSTFVSPGTLPAPASTSVLDDSRPRNYLAG